MATPTKLVLSLHNGKSAQPLNPGQPNLVKAQAGEHYRVLGETDGVAKPAGNVIARRSGNDLKLDYADGTSVILQDYYLACTGGAACEVTLPAANGGSFVVPANGADGAIVYAQGSHDTLMGMAQDNPAFSATLGALPGSEISYTGAAPTYVGASGAAGSSAAGAGAGAGESAGANAGVTAGNNNFSLLTGLGVLAGAAFVVGAASAIGGGGISKDSSTPAAPVTPSDPRHVVSGTVMAGPVIAGNDLVVNLFQLDGTTQLGTAKVDANGQYSIDVGTYSGGVIARVANGTAADYIDATTGQARNLSADLLAVGMATSATLTLNINPLTTVAATKAGAGFSGVSATSLNERTITDMNTGVAAAFGLTDLIGGEIVSTVTNTGAANPNFTTDSLSAGERYGAVLAALSGIDSSNSDVMQTTINTVVAGSLGAGDGAIISASLADALIAGSAIAAARFGTNTMPQAISNLLALSDPRITIDNVATDNIIGALETSTTLSGSVAAGAKVVLSIAGVEHAAVVDGTHWSYTLSAIDLAAMGQGGETLAPMATFADGSTATARRTVAIDTIAPAAIISLATSASGDGPVTFTFTFSEAVTGFDASDVVLTGGGVKGTFTAVSPTKYTLVVTPGAGGVDALAVNLAEGAAHDVLGNASKAVSSLDFGFGSTISLSNIAAGRGGFVIRGENAGDLSGLSISTAGDVNGDGLADLIVGARDNDAGGTNAGRAYVVFGKTDTTAVNLADIVAGKGGFVINGGPGLTTGSTTYGEEVGISVSAAGDLNGDGLADLLVGAPRTGYMTGRTYVVFGKASTAAVNVATLGTAGYQYSSASTAAFGSGVAGLGDVNGDGLNDMIVGMPYYDSNTTTLKDNGRAIVIFGSPAAQTASTLPNSGSIFQFGYTGVTAAETIGGLLPSATAAGGSLAAAGDFNGDGLADILIGVGDSDPNGTSSGRAYVIFGRTNYVPPGGTTNTAGLSDVSKGLGGFAIDGLAAGDAVGASAVGVGDVNGDGLADLLIGAKGADVDGRPDTGRSYVIFGRTGATTSVALTDIAAGRGGFVINGQAAGDASGFKVAAAGDVNGDGLADMLISANAADTSGGADAGRVYVVFGTSRSTPVELSAVATGHGGFVIDGAAGTDMSGAAVSAAGDINGDGLADLIVSATQADPNGLANAGATYVIFGATGGAFATTVDQVAGAGRATLTGTAATETLLGDINANTLIGNGGADVLYGGAGNDTIVVNASNVAALSAGFGSGGNVDQLARIDGGSGIDTLQLAGAGIALDLAAIRNVGMAGGLNMSRLTSIERIDLTGNGDNSLKLTMADVVDMAGMNSFNSGNGWTGLAAIEARHQLVIDGNAGDRVNSTGWIDTGKAVTNNGHTYEVYTAGAYTELLIDTAITRVLA